jgi:hypothetical protein
MHGTGHVNFEVVVTYIISYGFLVKIATLATKKRGCKGPKLGFLRKKCTKYLIMFQGRNLSICHI